MSETSVAVMKKSQFVSLLTLCFIMVENLILMDALKKKQRWEDEKWKMIKISKWAPRAKHNYRNK